MKLLRSLTRPVRDSYRHLRARAESGQAIVLIAFGAIGLIAIMGLAIDGGRLLFLRREAQNAADAAAIAASRAMCQGNPSYINVGLAAADVNGFDNSGLTADRNGNVVAINVPPTDASVEISPECAGCFLEAIVTGEIPPTFVGVVYGGPLQARGKAISACNQYLDGLGEIGLRAAFGLSPSCEVDITGSTFVVEGGAHANGALKFGATGGGGTVSGPATYYGSLELPGGADITFQPGAGSITYDTLAGPCDPSCFTDGPGGDDGEGEECDVPTDDAPFRVCNQQPDPLAYDIAKFQPGGEYALLAGSQYYSYTGSCKDSDVEAWLESHHNPVTHTLDDGLYYTTCDVDVNQSGVTGHITLVSEGTIHLSGGTQDLDPFMLSLLVFANGGSDKCSEKAIQLSGSSNKWHGNMYAPHGEAKFSASLNSAEIDGCIVAYDIDFSGSNTVIKCSATEPDASPGIWMTE